MRCVSLPWAFRDGGDLQHFVGDDVGQVGAAEEDVQRRLHRDAFQLLGDRLIGLNVFVIQGGLIDDDVHVLVRAQLVDRLAQRRILELDGDRLVQAAFDLPFLLALAVDLSLVELAVASIRSLQSFGKPIGSVTLVMVEAFHVLHVVQAHRRIASSREYLPS